MSRLIEQRSYTVDGSLEPCGYQQIVGLSSSTSLTFPAAARFALISVEGKSVRWRDDGTAPTASVGNPIAQDGVVFYTGALDQLKFIETAASATLNVNYYR